MGGGSKSSQEAIAQMLAEDTESCNAVGKDGDGEKANRRKVQVWDPGGGEIN